MHVTNIARTNSAFASKLGQNDVRIDQRGVDGHSRWWPLKQHPDSVKKTSPPCTQTYFADFSALDNCPAAVQGSLSAAATLQLILDQPHHRDVRVELLHENIEKFLDLYLSASKSHCQ